MSQSKNLETFYRTLFPNYEVEKQIGEGAFSNVFLARHLPSGEKVAMKVVKRKEVKTRLDILAVQREKIIAPYLKHPHIIRVREVLETSFTPSSELSFISTYKCSLSSSVFSAAFGSSGSSTSSSSSRSTSSASSPATSQPTLQKLTTDEDERKRKKKQMLVLITDCCIKGDLLKVLTEEGGRLSEDAARKVFIGVLSAVDYLHKNNIAHRDIKLENILLDDKNEARLADFGLSTSFHSSSKISEYVGSVNYSAPELIAGTPYIGPEVDVWALGILLFSMVAGKMPFMASTEEETKSRVLQGLFFIPPHFSPSLSDLLRKILVPSTSLRLSLPMLIAHPWVQEGKKLLSRFSYTDKYPLPSSLYELLQDEQVVWENKGNGEDSDDSQEEGDEERMKRQLREGKEGKKEMPQVNITANIMSNLGSLTSPKSSSVPRLPNAPQTPETASSSPISPSRSSSAKSKSKSGSSTRPSSKPKTGLLAYASGTVKTPIKSSSSAPTTPAPASPKPSPITTAPSTPTLSIGSKPKPTRKSSYNLFGTWGRKKKDEDVKTQPSSGVFSLVSPRSKK